MPYHAGQMNIAEFLNWVKAADSFFYYMEVRVESKKNDGLKVKRWCKFLVGYDVKQPDAGMVNYP